MSQYKTCIPNTVTIQNMYTYHCHITKHVHLPLSKYKTCTRTTVTIQNMFTYYQATALIQPAVGVPPFQSTVINKTIIVGIGTHL